MSPVDGLRIEVAYADPEREILMLVTLPRGVTAGQAIEICGLSRLLSDAGIDCSQLAVHGRRVAPERELAAGDRVEVLRALQVNPKTARKRRAKRSRRTNGQQ